MQHRRITEVDLESVLALIRTDPDGPVPTADRYLELLTAGQYRLDHTWIAVSDDPAIPVRALAVWWAGPDEPAPAALDAIYVAPDVPERDRATLAAELLRAAHTAFGLPDPPAHHVFVPADWHDRPDVVAAVAWRRDAVAAAGLPVPLERLRYTWEPSDGLPPRSDRLTFAAEPDDEVFVDLFQRVLAGTLDATSRTEAAQVGAERQAREDLALYRDLMVGDRAWWRVARDGTGAVVGFGLPSRNLAHPVVGYLGVLPEHRGHGYVDDILAEITGILSDQGAEQIRADTDLGNVPMAASFERAGYRNVARRLVFSAH